MGRPLAALMAVGLVAGACSHEGDSGLSAAENEQLGHIISPIVIHMGDVAVDNADIFEQNGDSLALMTQNGEDNYTLEVDLAEDGSVEQARVREETDCRDDTSAAFACSRLVELTLVVPDSEDEDWEARKRTYAKADMQDYPREYSTDDELLPGLGVVDTAEDITAEAEELFDEAVLVAGGTIAA